MTGNSSTGNFQLLPDHELISRFQSVMNGGQKSYAVRFALDPSAFPSGAPRTSHTWATRHLAGSIRDVGFANPCESVFAGLRKYNVGEA